MASPAPKGHQVSLVDSLRRLAAWLKEHDAAPLMQTLSPAARPLHLTKLEQKLGFALPVGQRTFWLLHDGQRKPTDCLVSDLHLLPVAWVMNQQPATLALVAKVRSADVGPAAGLTPEEVESNQWLSIASNRERRVLVNAKSGRVFESLPEAPFLTLVGASVPQWLEAWVDAVERGDHQLVQSHAGAFFTPAITTDLTADADDDEADG
jgi:cell wall assembly regulator SMI1